MKTRLVPISLVCVFMSCGIIDFFDRDCSDYFYEFSELRLNVYLDPGLDSSYYAYENWSYDQNVVDWEIDSEIKDSLYVVKLIFPDSAMLYMGDEQIFLDFGNGDVDTIDIDFFGIDSIECYEAQWVEASVGADSLVRDDDLAFVYHKRL